MSLRLRLVSILIAMVLVIPVIVSPARIWAQTDASEVAQAGLVSNAYRVVAYQTVIGPEIAEAKVPRAANGVHALVVVDVTNTGVSAPLDLAVFQLGITEGSLLEMTSGVEVDRELTISASQALQLQGVGADGSMVIAENSNVRLALVFPLPAEPAEGESLVLRVNDQVMSLDDTMMEALMPLKLPAMTPTMAVEPATINEIKAGATLAVTMDTGETREIQFEGVVSSAGNTVLRSSCYAGEATSQINGLTGGRVWLEKMPDGRYLVWFNNAAAGNFGLVNSFLVAGGFAGADADSPSAYASWLGSVEEWAKGQAAGLWSVCTNAEGAWISMPTPTAVPTLTAEQIRGQYQWIDVRDLAINPDQFKGEKIAVSGSVFNIQIQDGMTAIQIWLNGGSDAATIVYEGELTGVYEGTWITVYGFGAGTFSGTNAFGGTIIQPLIGADIIDY